MPNQHAIHYSLRYKRVFLYIIHLGYQIFVVNISTARALFARRPQLSSRYGQLCWLNGDMQRENNAAEHGQLKSIQGSTDAFACGGQTASFCFLLYLLTQRLRRNEPQPREHIWYESWTGTTVDWKDLFKLTGLCVKYNRYITVSFTVALFRVLACSIAPIPCLHCTI